MRINEIKSALPLTTSQPKMPPVKPPKKEKVKRIYEDDDFVIDLFTEEKIVRVSVFDSGHFKDEVFVRREDYIDWEAKEIYWMDLWNVRYRIYRNN